MGEPLEASVTLDEIFSVVSSKRVPLAPELAGYLTLEIAETPAARDGEVDPRYVYVGEEGTVALVRPKKDADMAVGDPEASIRALLGKLLEVGGSQTPALGAAAKKKAGGGLEPLVEELEAALIPVNRGAGRRALARLAREVKRVTLGVGRNAMRSSGDLAAAAPVSQRSQESQAPASVPKQKVPPASTSFEAEEQSTASHPLQQPPSMSELPTIGLTREDIDKAQGKKSQRDSVDSLLDKFEVSEKREDKALSKDLKAMAGLDATPPPPASMPGAERDSIDALLSATTGSIPDLKSDRPPTKPEGPASRRPAKVEVTPTPPHRAPSPSFADERSLPTGPASVSRLGSMADIKKKKRGTLFPFIAILVLVGLMAAILWMLKPGFFTGRTPEKIAEEQRIAAQKEEERKAALANNVPCKAAVVVSGAPDGAEILVRAGAAPVDIERMPVGPRLEIVATMDGWSPKRAVIPQGAQWEKGSDGKPRFEIGVQLDKSKRPNAVDPWPPAEPGSEVGGKGDPGTVHVVSTPKGSDIWLVVGQGPDARIDELVRCDADAELLVAGPTTYRKRLSVKAADFAADPQEKGNVRVARVTVPKK
jgi:hypothetical protein